MWLLWLKNLVISTPVWFSSKLSGPCAIAIACSRCHPPPGVLVTYCIVGIALWVVGGVSSIPGRLTTSDKYGNFGKPRDRSRSARPWSGPSVALRFGRLPVLPPDLLRSGSSAWAPAHSLVPVLDTRSFAISWAELARDSCFRFISSVDEESRV